jgi:hypothetical protein
MRRSTNDRSFLFFTILALVVLTQMVVLRWRPDAVFFVTWLFLALTVQHDSRISAAVGLAFLATCPFLLIAEKQAVAEQAADYAFYFLAIGVLVQLEELLLERHGWPDRRLDLSHLSRPAIRALERRWSAAVRALDQLTATDRAELVRLVQITGTGGLALVFLGAAFVGARLPVLMPLLGGVMLFPFLVWGGRLAVRVVKPVRLLRAVLALGILALASVEMVWLYDVISADRLAHMQTTYNFTNHLDQAVRTSPIPDGESVGLAVWTIKGVSRRAFYVRPAFAGASRVAYSVRIERGAVLAFDVATVPDSWEQPGDGITFAIYAESDQGVQQLFSTYIDPKHDEADRCWHPYAIDLSAYAGQMLTLIFETSTGPAGDHQHDLAGWGGVRLLTP